LTGKTRLRNDNVLMGTLNPTHSLTHYTTLPCERYMPGYRRYETNGLFDNK